MRKRILTLQDYSCLGRCSLTVALPTISAAGIEAVGIPTALLSNHTAFPSWTLCDLTSEILPIVRKWDEKDRVFDAVYTGYLTTNQIEDVKEVFRLTNNSKIRFVDPAMADHGKLYAGFDERQVIAMRELVALADITKPNVTEACLLAGVPMALGPQKEEIYLGIAKKIGNLGPKIVIISGAHSNEGKLGCYLYSKEDGTGKLIEFDCLPGNYHGTGDLFASALISMIVKGKTNEEAIQIAHNVTRSAIELNLKDGVDGVRYGPEFERVLKLLEN